jgi:uncharacterized RDD family membrane protein YckC
MEKSTLPSINPIENPKARYALAKAWNRIFARIIDSLLLMLVIAGIAVLIMLPDSNGIQQPLNLADK